MNEEIFEIDKDNDLRSRFNGQYATCELPNLKLGNFAKSEAEELQDFADETGLDADEALEVLQDL